ncbi:MAG TPA: LPS export ABC transporter periplasmic protein LptC [Rhodothermales bacterium]|nr:LPS export ABC transporter periplasmic protein LptC [Rhodothermales bacterium]
MLSIRLIALVSCVLLMGAGCEYRAGEAASLDTVRAEGEPDQESWDAHIFVTDVPQGAEASRNRMELIADYMARYEREDSTYMLLRSHPDSLASRVIAHLFDASGDSSATVTADRMLYFDQEQRFEARGEVIVVTKEGKRLESEHLVWNEAEREVRTPGFVSITTETQRMQGYGLVAEEDLATYRISRVTAQVMLEDDE